MISRRLALRSAAGSSPTAAAPNRDLARRRASSTVRVPNRPTVIKRRGALLPPPSARYRTMKVFVPLFSTRKPNPERSLSQRWYRPTCGAAASTMRLRARLADEAAVRVDCHQAGQNLLVPKLLTVRRAKAPHSSIHRFTNSSSRGRSHTAAQGHKHSGWAGRCRSSLPQRSQNPWKNRTRRTASYSVIFSSGDPTNCHLSLGPLNRSVWRLRATGCQVQRVNAFCGRQALGGVFFLCS